MLDFPNPPLTDGQFFLGTNGVPYKWQATPGMWVEATAVNFTGSGVVVLQTSPQLLGDPKAVTPPLGDNDTSIATTAFVQAAIVDATASVHPEQFGAVGNGITIDDTAIRNWLAYCWTNEVKAVGTPKKIYNLSSSFHQWIRTDFDGNGCEFTSTNHAGGQQVFTIDSQLADVETLTKDHINTWSNMRRGSAQIPELGTEKGWSYWFETQDEWILARAYFVPLAGLNKGEAFQVVDHAGRLSKTLNHNYTMPFASATGERRRIRRNMTVKDLIIRITTGTGKRNRILYVFRPNTTLIGCRLRNETVDTIDQGYVHGGGATNIVYDNCRVEGLTPDNYLTTVNYGWNGGICDDITFRNCHGSECRRNIDSHRAANYKIDGGVFSDGVGGHWLDGLHIYGNAYISNQHNDNPTPIHLSGSNCNVESATIHCKSTPYESAVCDVRSDFPELRGLYRVGPGVTITIDDDWYPSWQNETAYKQGALVRDTASGMPWRCEVTHTSGIPPMTFYDYRFLNPTHWVAYGHTKSIINFPLPPGPDPYDPGREVFMPTTVDCRPGVIRQIGKSSANYICLVNINARTAALFTQRVVMPKQVIVEPGGLELEGGYTVGGAERLVVYLGKNDLSYGRVLHTFPNWQNSTGVGVVYSVGATVIDAVAGTVWESAVSHTSPVAPTTFAQYRTANPTHWVAYDQTGETCKVRVAGIRRTNILTPAASAAAGTSVGRYDLEVEGISDSGAQIGVAYGVIRKAIIKNCDPGTLIIPSSAVPAPLGDEEVAFDVTATYTPTMTTGTNGASATGIIANYQRTTIGTQTRVRVIGAASISTTASGSTQTNLYISLPPGILFGVPNDLTGQLLVGSGGYSTSTDATITKDPTVGQHRALMSWPSLSTGPISMYFTFEYTLGA